MIKTVNVQKKFRLDELIKYIFDNDIAGKRFEERSDYKSYSITHAVHVTGEGVVNVEGLFNLDTTFIVEEEEEIDYDTVFEEVYRVTKEGYVTSDKNKSIGECLDWKDYQVQIFAMLDGKLQLIWEANNDVD